MAEIPQILKKALQSAGIDPTTVTVRGNVITSADGSTYFARTSRDTKQITGEIESLKALAKTGHDLVPKIYAFEVDEKREEAAMISQYFDLGGGRSIRESQQELARRVAKLHTTLEGDMPEGRYGFRVPTHCGVTEQDNTWEDDWEVFFRDRRLGDLVKRIGDDKINNTFEELKIK
jgi:protein-ribulosamine 3-kinase